MAGIRTRVRPGERLLDARARLERDERDTTDRLQRIASATPPTHTFEGAVQRWRDGKRAEADSEYETVWNGGEGLTSMGERRAI